MAAIGLSTNHLTTQFSDASPANQFNEIIKYDPVSSRNSNAKWSRIWVVAAWTSVIAFTAFAAASVALVTIYAPAQLPIAIIVSLISMQILLPLFKYSQRKSEDYAVQAKFDRGILKELRAMTPQSAREIFAKQGIETSLSGKDLKRLAARFSFLDKMRRENFDNFTASLAQSERELELRVDDTIAKISPHKVAIKEVDFADEGASKRFAAVQFARELGLGRYQDATEIHVKMAYLLKVAAEPHNQAAMDTFFERADLSLKDRVIAREYKDPNHDLMMRKEGESISRQRINLLSTRKLAEVLFDLPPLTVLENVS